MLVLLSDSPPISFLDASAPWVTTNGGCLSNDVGLVQNRQRLVGMERRVRGVIVALLALTAPVHAQSVASLMTSGNVYRLG
jgi:hypothetical protein